MLRCISSSMQPASLGRPLRFVALRFDSVLRGSLVSRSPPLRFSRQNLPFRVSISNVSGFVVFLEAMELRSVAARVCLLVLLALVGLSTAQSPIIFTHFVSSPNTSVCIPMGYLGGANTPNVTIEWGDSTIQNITSAVDCDGRFNGAAVHTYASAGNYTVAIYGRSSSALRSFGWSILPLTQRIFFLDILSFGSLDTVSLANLLAQQPYLRSVPPSLPPTVTTLYGMFYMTPFTSSNISLWDVSKVTSMASLFSDNPIFNAPLSSWNTSSVTTFAMMFSSARLFNQPVNSFRTGSATSLNGMFAWTDSFNQPLDQWDTSKVVSFDGLFRGSLAFNQPLNSWDVSKGTSFSGMFASSVFNQPLNSWNVAKATSLKDMFSINTVFNQNLNNWNTSAVGDMSGCFTVARSFNANISSWDTSRVTTFRSMFSSASAFNQPLRNWRTSSATDMARMFNNATSFNQDLDTWDTSTVTDFSNMFELASSFNGNISTWRTGNATSLSAMFKGSSFNRPIASWDVSKVISFWSLFSGTPFNQALNSWNTSSLIGMQYIFSTASQFNQPIDRWSVAKVADFTGIFASASAFNQSLNSWNTAKVTKMISAFDGATSFNQPLDNWNVTSLVNATSMFYNATSFSQSLASWCVPAINYTPVNFAVACPLQPAQYPRWSCSSLAPVSAPWTSPSPPPQSSPVAFSPPSAAPIPVPSVAPTSTPVAAPALAPVPPVSLCPQPLPSYALNATCISQIWIFSVEACQFFQTCAGNPGGLVSVPSGSAISLVGNTTANNISLSIQTNSSAVFLAATGCLNLTGNVSLAGLQTPTAGSRLEILTVVRPECSDIDLSTTFSVGDGCSKIVGSVGHELNSSGIKVIFITFSSNNSGCTNSPSVLSPQTPDTKQQTSAATRDVWAATLAALGLMFAVIT